MIEGQRCLVTGGAGTIGSTIVDQLVAAGAAEVVVLDNFVRGRPGEPRRRAGGGQGPDGRGRHPRPRRWSPTLMAGIDLVFHQAAIRITQCAEEPRLALEVLVDGTFNVLEAAADAGVRKVVAASSASVYGLAEEFPTTERQHPYDNDTLLRRGQGVQRGHAAQLPRHVRPGLRGAALLQRVRPADGHPRPLHRGADPLDGADRGRAAAADPRRRPADHGLRVHRRTSPGPTCWPRRGDVTDEVFNIASGTETSLRELAEALLEVMGARPGAGVRAGPRGQRGDPAAGRRRRGRASGSGWKAEVGLRRRACAGWSTGGASERGRRRSERRDPIPVMRPWLGEEEAAAAAEAVALRLGRPGPAGGRVRGARSPSASAPGTRSRSSSCTTALHLALVAAGHRARATRSSSRRSRSSPPPTRVRYVGADAGVRRRRRGDAATSPPETVEPLPDRAHPRGHRRRPGRGPGRRGRAPRRSASRAASPSSRTRPARPARRYRGRAGRRGRRARRLVLPPAQAAHHRRGRHAHHRRRRAWPPGLRRLREHGMNVSAAERHASRQPVLEQLPRGRLQLPDDRHPGRGRAGPARPARRDSSPGGASWPRATRSCSADVPGLRTVARPGLRRRPTSSRSGSLLAGRTSRLSRDELLAALAEAGISARRGIMAAHHRAGLRRPPARAPLPVTERLTADSLILPLFHQMTEAEQDQVVSVIHAAAGVATPAGRA